MRLPVLACLVALLTTTASADPLLWEGLRDPFTPEYTPGSSCQVGDPGPAFFRLISPHTGSFKIVTPFQGGADCAVCALTLDISTIHVILSSAAPCNPVVKPFVLLADLSDPQCPVPGALWCEGTETTVALTGSGAQTISVDLDCACMDIDGAYYVGVEVFDYCTSGLRYYASGIVQCASYVNDGTGFSDPGGSIVLWGDGHCCTPIPVEDETWGGIKSQF